MGVVAKKQKKNELKEVSSVVLTGLQEAEIIEYVNWSDGDFGARSVLGAIIDRLEDGTSDISIAPNPENAIIRNIDRIARHRVIHRAMTSIGLHARTLSQAYTIAPKPPYVVKHIGEWLSGVALSTVPNLERFLRACNDVSLGKEEGLQQNKDLIFKVRLDITKRYNSACRAYVAALAAAKPPVRVPEPARKFRTAPHHCRDSTVYPCPCGAK